MKLTIADIWNNTISDNYPHITLLEDGNFYGVYS